MRKQLCVFSLLLLWADFASAATVTLSWSPPDQNTDGSPLTDLAGYKIYYGPSSGNYLFQVDVDNPGATSYQLDGLPEGDHYFVATAYNEAGIESEYSNEVMKTLVDETTPNPPVDLFVSEDITVYSVAKIENGFLLIAIGTVPFGTTCYSQYSVNGKYAVDLSSVTMANPNNPVPLVAVADCQ